MLFMRSDDGAKNPNHNRIEARVRSPQPFNHDRDAAEREHNKPAVACTIVVIQRDHAENTENVPDFAGPVLV